MYLNMLSNIPPNLLNNEWVQTWKYNSNNFCFKWDGRASRRFIISSFPFEIFLLDFLHAQDFMITFENAMGELGAEIRSQK